MIFYRQSYGLTDTGARSFVDVYKDKGTMTSVPEGRYLKHVLARVT